MICEGLENACGKVLSKKNRRAQRVIHEMGSKKSEGELLSKYVHNGGHQSAMKGKKIC